MMMTIDHDEDFSYDINVRIYLIKNPKWYIFFSCKNDDQWLVGEKNSKQVIKSSNHTLINNDDDGIHPDLSSYSGKPV